MSSRDLTLCVLLLYCTVLSCRAQYQLFSQNCSRITSTGVTEYLICAEGTISLAATRDRFNISVTPSDSECGATPQDYCTQELPPVCDQCDQNVPTKTHGVENMVDIVNFEPDTSTWWQSKTWAINPQMPLAVNICLSFDHLYELQNLVSITFKSVRPKRMKLVTSNDFGATWRTLRYYQKNCDDLYAAGVPTEATVQDPEAVTCVTKYSSDTPYTNGVVTFDVTHDIFRLFLGNTLTDYAALYAAFNRTTLNKFLSFTDICFELLEPSTGGKAQKDSSNSIQFYYAVSSISIQASCSCYLHAKSCSELGGQTTCDCEHNTDGVNCEKCLPLYNNRPWRKGFYHPYPNGNANECEKCECYDHADSCTYNEALRFGTCNDCKHNTTGLKCESCMDEFYPNATLPINDMNRCVACDCEPHGVDPGNMRCEPVTGQCTCKSAAVTGRRCDLCNDGTYGLLIIDNSIGTCKPCACVRDGTVAANPICEKALGQCACKPNVGERDCSICKDGFYAFPSGRPNGDCFDCQCNPGGSITPTCNKATGQCPCHFGLAGRQCDRPISDTYAPFLEYFAVQPSGGTCKLDTALLTSPIPFTGRTFSRCAASQLVSFGVIDGKQLQPQVKWSFLPALRYTLNSTEPWQSASLTITQQGDSGISMTSYRARANDQGIPASCNPDMSIPTVQTIQLSAISPEIGQVWLSSGSVTLDARCRYRVEQTVGDAGLVNDSLIVDSIVFIPNHNDSLVYQRAAPDVQNAMRNCERSLLALSTRQAARLDEVCSSFVFATTLQMGVGAQPCGCDAMGTLPGTTCETKGGQCQCKPGVYGRKCDVCEPGYYNRTLQGCVSCDCNEKGSANLVCDYTNGQCPCQPKVAMATEGNVLGLIYDLKCSSCQLDYYGHMTGEGCKPCGCNAQGMNTSQCDDTGQCLCKPTIGGNQCQACLPGYYSFSATGCRLCNCSKAGSIGIECDQSLGQCTCKVNTNDVKCSTCVVGSFNLQELNPDGCQKCFCYGHGAQCQSASGYSSKRLTALETEIQGWTMIDPFGSTSSSETHYVAADRFLGNKQTTYGNSLSIKAVTQGGVFVDYSSEDSIVLVGNGGEIIKYNSSKPMVASANLTDFVIEMREHYWYYNATSKPDYLKFYEILADLSGIYIQRVFRSANIVNMVAFSLYTTQLAPPGSEPVTSVEQCTCNSASFVDGLSCEKCAVGYKRPVINGSSYETCTSCDCNSKAYTDPPVCDENTGDCLNCKNGTSGNHCEACAQFVDGCSTCTDTNCGACTNNYWGMSQQGCNGCECNPIGSTNLICDKTSGNCACQPKVGERRCDQCVDNYFGISTSGCQECDTCYGLVKADVDKIRAIRDNITQLVNDIQAKDSTANVGAFGPRLKEIQTDMKWLLLYLAEAKATQADILAEVQRLNTTLMDLNGVLTSTGIDLVTAQSQLASAANNTAMGRNTTGDIQYIMIEANAVLNANTENTTKDIEALLYSIQQVQSKMAGVSNDAIGDILRVSNIVNSIQTGSSQAKATADEAYLTSQDGQNQHRQTTSGVSILDQSVLGVNKLSQDMKTSATYALGNASVSLAIANLALRNATNMAPITTDVPNLISRALMQTSEAQALKVQSEAAQIQAAATVNIVNSAAIRTNLLKDRIDSVSMTSSLLQLRLDEATKQVTNAKNLANQSFANAGRMLEIKQNFNAQVQAVKAQADEALSQVQEIQKQGEQSIIQGRTLQAELQAPLDRTQTALQTATSASQITAANTALFDESFNSAESLGNYSSSVLNDVNIYPEITANINNTVVAPGDQTCNKYKQQTTQLQETTLRAVTSANNASFRVSETTTKINSILQSFQNVQNIDQARLATLRVMMETAKSPFDKELLTTAIMKLKTAKDEQRAQLENMKAKKTQIQAKIRRLKDIQEQLRTTSN